MLFLAIFAALFGIFHVVRTPRKMTEAAFRPVEIPTSSPEIPSSLDTAIALQAKDTDGDGISDGDELNRYKTSPYLKDSDSDGFDDKTEIETGNDPNCPRGTTCATTTLPGASVSVPAPAAPPFSPELLRETLRKQGVSEEQVRALDDATLKKLYDETVKDLGATPVPSAPLPAVPPATSSPTASPEEFFRTATPDQLRAFLKSNGIADNVLQAVDDTTLRTLVLETLKDIKK